VGGWDPISEAVWQERCRGRIRYIPVGEGRYSAELGDDPEAAKAARTRRVSTMGDKLRKQGVHLRSLPKTLPETPEPDSPAPGQFLGWLPSPLPEPAPAPDLQICCPACGHVFPFCADGGLSDMDIALSVLKGTF
jgi:hypothetical protein